MSRTRAHRRRFTQADARLMHDIIDQAELCLTGIDIEERAALWAHAPDSDLMVSVQMRIRDLTTLGELYGRMNEYINREEGT